MTSFRIYYSDSSVVYGETREEWSKAPDEGVQVVVQMTPPDVPHWTREVDGKPIPVTDRMLWTGDDEYDPFGWGTKQGELIDTGLYFQIWEKACGDN